MEAVKKRSTRIWFKLMTFGSKMGCHQMPDRSFFFRGYQFPVCARCTGVILGEFATVIMLCCSVKFSLLLSIALLIPMGIDWGLQFLKILPSSNIRRLLSGALGGIGLTYLYYYFFKLIVHTVKAIL